MLVLYTGGRALASLTETVVEDFILGLLWCVLDALLEALFEYVLAALFDLCFRAVRAIFNLEFPNAALAAIGYALLGFAAGGSSLIYFPHPLVHPSRIHGVSLFISPMITGLLMSLTGSFLRKRDKRVLQFESFGYGFAFAFGIALARLLWAK